MGTVEQNLRVKNTLITNSAKKLNILHGIITFGKKSKNGFYEFVRVIVSDLV